MATEIYSCKDGQELKQGKLDISHDITTRQQAEGDAKGRCQRDASLKKVVYYKVADDGGFKMFYSYTNPHCKPTAPPAAGVAVRKKAPARRPEPKPGWLARLKTVLGL
jgi:hypothetical protein